MLGECHLIGCHFQFFQPSLAKVDQDTTLLAFLPVIGAACLLRLRFCAWVWVFWWSCGGFCGCVSVPACFGQFLFECLNVVSIEAAQLLEMVVSFIQ